MLLSEPAPNLDIILRAGWAATKTVSILLVEHNVDLALECADYYYILDKSSIDAQGETHSLHVDTIKEHLVV